MNERAPADFGEATSSLLEFLRKENVASEVEWLTREDLMLVRGRFFVKLPIPPDNLARAREQYREGLERGLGVELEVVCWIGDCAYSRVYVPEDERNAELHMMPQGLKMSYPLEGVFNSGPSRRDQRRAAIPVRSKIKWWILNQRAKKNEELTAWLFD